MSNININNTTLHYNDYGSGAVIVFIHGNGSSLKMYDSEIRYYANYYRTIAFDLPGHGKSSPYNDDNGVNFWKYSAELLKQALRELGVRKYVIIGVDGGAIVGLYLAITDKENAEGLFADSFEGNRLSMEYVNKIDKERKRIQENFFYRMFYRYLHGAMCHENLNNDSKILKAFAENQECFFNETIDFYSPVVLSCSTKDREITQVVSKMEELAKLIPNVKIITFQGGKHPSCLSNRDSYRLMVKRFMDDKTVEIS